MKKLPHILALVYLVYWAVLAIDPFSRATWVAENIPVLGVFLLLVVTFKKFRFSNTSYVLMSLWIFWHTMGGHYTFANVPFDWVTDMFGFERNHFDRVGHFIIGFYAYPVAEYLTRTNRCSRPLALLFGLFSIMSLAAAYEIIEWWYAVLEGGESGLEVLGSQGDIWDAQSDMLMDTLGAVASLILFYRRGDTENSV